MLNDEPTQLPFAITNYQLLTANLSNGNSVTNSRRIAIQLITNANRT